MSIADDISTQIPDKAPKGWEPFAEESEQVGSAIVRLPRPNATERDLLASSGFDPDLWRISGPIQTRRWMRFDQEWLFYYKFEVEQGESVEVKEVHVEELTKRIRRRKPVQKADRRGGDAWVAALSDWQVGKREGDNGTPETVDRVVDCIDQSVQRVKDLRRIGRPLETGALLGLGDIVEGCMGNYPNQQFLVDCNRRDQNRISRELICYAIDSLSPLFEHFSIATVGGNHGENRGGLQAKLTDDADNDDVAVFETVKEAYDRAGHEFDWLIPHDELSIALTLGGVKVGATHGHIFRKGATAQQKQLAWFQAQDFGFQPVRDARILITAHFHHFIATQVGSRTMFQTPALDPGSKWFRDSSGEDAPPGMLTMRLSAAEQLGWSDLEVLTPAP